MCTESPFIGQFRVSITGNNTDFDGGSENKAQNAHSLNVTGINATWAEQMRSIWTGGIIKIPAVAK